MKKPLNKRILVFLARWTIDREITDLDWSEALLYWGFILFFTLALCLYMLAQ